MQQVRNENKSKTLEQNTWAKHLREQNHIKLSTIKDDGKWKRCKKCNIGSQSTKIVSHNGTTSRIHSCKDTPTTNTMSCLAQVFSPSILKIILSQILTDLAVTPPSEGALLAAVPSPLPPSRGVPRSVAVLLGTFDEAEHWWRRRHIAPQL